MNPTRMEFREKLREGLVVTYHLKNGSVEIIIEDLNRDDEIWPFHQDEE